MKEIKVGLIGFGTVGQGLAEVLLTQRERLVRRTGMSIKLVGIADHSTYDLPERFKDIRLTQDGMQLVNDPDIDIIVELILFFRVVNKAFDDPNVLRKRRNFNTDVFYACHSRFS